MIVLRRIKFLYPHGSIRRSKLVSVKDSECLRRQSEAKSQGLHIALFDSPHPDEDVLAILLFHLIDVISVLFFGHHSAGYVHIATDRFDIDTDR